MTFPVDTTEPVFPALTSAQVDGVQTVGDARRLLQCDRAAWVWSRRVLLQLQTFDAEAGAVLARARVLLSPIPAGWERVLRVTAVGSRTVGTDDVTVTVGATVLAVELGTTQSVETDDALSPGGGEADVVVDDGGGSGDVSVLLVLYEDVGRLAP